MRLLSRITLTLSGGAFAAFVVAWLDALSVGRRLAEGGATLSPARRGAFIAVDVGVIGPLALTIAAIVGFGALVLEPPRSTTLLEDIVAVRATRTRVRTAALAPIIVLSTFLVTVATGHAGRSALRHSGPVESAFTMAAAAVGMSLVAFALALAVLPSLWKALARYAPGTPMTDPVVTGGTALGIAAMLFGIGIVTGDPGGSGGGLPGVDLFAVLTRPDLDLRPVVHVVVVMSLAYLGGKLAFLPMKRVVAGVGMAVIVVIAGLSVRAASVLNSTPEITDLFEHAALGNVSLTVLRRATDRDGDGYAALFGGGDCDDRDARVNPAAIDVAGNGIDEDCSGEDAQIPAPDVPAAPQDDASDSPDAPPMDHRPFNVVLFTIDTLRFDLGFTGYPRPVTPNIDKLAESSIVFERAYSMASYTAKSMGSLMMGKYASEALRNWDHYTAYSHGNTFLAERLSAAGTRTLAGHCHYYFQWNTGYSRGFDVYDSSAIPPNMADGDSSITSDRLSDLALRLLSRPENVTPRSGRPFFAWFHYFDPHAQYVRHQGAPDFRSMPGAPANRAGYDEEVWFTDKHVGRVLDFIASQPWAANTAIIITADHGEAFGDAHGVKTHGHELWESLVRVPLVMYVPNARPRRVRAKRSHIDLAPTIMDLVGAKAAPPGQLRGKSLLPDVYGDESKVEERDIYLDMPEGPYNEVRRAILTGPTPGMKLIHFGATRYQLYDLGSDPAENNDLASNPDVLRPALDRMNQLRSRLKEISVVGTRISQ